ncbi:ESPR domain-containing protein, partial [Megamonas hypermegale]|uniref:ESPR domain-containing protein n=1 Tax=Megamonas hypermegale TaxID=158847 RepID=UPI0025A47328
MNKIYKVIWSKVKHQYVVVSELAHSNGKQNSKSERTTVSGSLRALAAALVVSGSLLAMPYTASAAEGDVYYQLQNGDEVVNIEENDLSSYFKIAEKQADGTYTINGQIVANEYLYDLGIDFNGDGKTEVGAFVVNDNIYTGDVYNQNHDVVIPEVQHTITNEDGFYASNGKGTYNSLTKDGLWVGGTKDGEGFHVDNDGNVRTTGNMMVDGKFSAGDNTIYVDENGMVDFGNVADGTGVLVNSTTGSITATGSIAANQVIGKELGGGNGAFKVTTDGKMTTTGEVLMKNDSGESFSITNGTDSGMNLMTVGDNGTGMITLNNGTVNLMGGGTTTVKVDGNGTTFGTLFGDKTTNINGDTVTTGK